MTELRYENQGTNTFLVCTIKEEDQLDTMNLGMLTNNMIPGFAQTQFSQVDTTKYIRYNVSSKISAGQLFSGSINRKRLVGVFSGIVDAMLSAEEYMIDPRSILLDLDYIFVDVTTCETILICLPIVNAEQKEADLGAFFKQIIFSTQFDQSENCDYVAKIINYLNSAPVFSAADFKEVLEEIKRGGGASAFNHPQCVQPPVYQPVPQPLPPETKPVPMSQQPQAQRPKPVEPVQPLPAQPGIPTTQPAATPKKEAVPNVQGSGTAPEEKISLFYLLQHYNKENAAAYKAQKAAKKNSRAESVSEAKSAKKEKKAKPAAPAAFAIPGQQPVMPGSGKQSAAQERAGATPLPQASASNSLNQKPAKPQNSTKQQPQVPQVAQPIAVPQTAPAVQSVAPQGQPAAQNMSFGETTVLGGSGMGETTVLGAAQSTQQAKPFLLRTKNNERILIDKPSFRIGKERSFVDYFVSDNSAVSRSHAIISTRDGNYFITDTNSTNHTYVNGGIIQSNEEVFISHGTKIRLADEEFEFRLY